MDRDSSEDPPDLEALRSVVVDFHPQAAITQGNKGKVKGAQTADDDREDDAKLPDRFQEALWRALERRLEGTMANESLFKSAIVRQERQPHEAQQHPAKPSGVKLFRRAAKQATFSAETVNRRVKHIPAAPAAIVAHPRGLHANAISDSEVLKRAAAAAVDADKILEYASRSAAAARRHVVEPDSSDSGLDTKAGLSTITRALRAVKGTKQRRRKSAAAHGAGVCTDQHQLMEKADESQACSSQQPPAADRQQNHIGKEASPNAKQFDACKRGLSEEEKRARKRAKWLAQKQRMMAVGADEERRAKEKARRARKKVRLKLQKQEAGAHSGVV